MFESPEKKKKLCMGGKEQGGLYKVKFNNKLPLNSPDPKRKLIFSVI